MSLKVMKIRRTLVVSSSATGLSMTPLTPTTILLPILISGDTLRHAPISSIPSIEKSLLSKLRLH